MSAILSVVITASTVLAAANSPTASLTSYGDALKQTQATGKPLLVLIDAPRTNETAVRPASFTQGDAQREVMQRYTVCRIDASTEYGQQVAEAFGTTTFPYTAIIDRTGKHVLYRKAGHQTAAEFVTTLDRYKTGIKAAPVRAQCFT